MTPYKAIATHLQKNSVTSQFSDGIAFFPVQAPDSYSTDNVYGVFTMIDDNPETTFGGGFDCGVMEIEFDFYSKDLGKIDNTINKFKSIFVGQSILLDSTIEMAYAETQSETDAFDEQTKQWIRSLDLTFKYIIK